MCSDTSLQRESPPCTRQPKRHQTRGKLSTLSISQEIPSLKPGFYRDQLSKFLDFSIGESLSLPYFSPKYQLPDFPLTLKNFFFPTIPCSVATQQRCFAHELGPFLYSGAPLIWPHTHKPLCPNSN